MESASSRARCYSSAIKPCGVAIRGPRGLGRDKGFVKRAATRNTSLRFVVCMSAIACDLPRRSTMPILFRKQGFAEDDFGLIRVWEKNSRRLMVAY